MKTEQEHKPRRQSTSRLSRRGGRGEGVTTRDKVAVELSWWKSDAEMGKCVEESDRILSITEADARERERKAFFACAAQIMEPFWDLPPDVTTLEWADAEAARRYKP
jgi:hypothetical protein